ncbi:CFC_collapsed_G0036820.mRNA.1.CDS.1 [Saccharomyces cerevisiae]|nr:CFC_collapsed_G0036820.mRNA.1.CDS.1 [Saccharomyces cerevisiae]
MPNFHLINICVFYRYYNFFLMRKKNSNNNSKNNNTGFFFLGLHKVLHPNLERDNRVSTTL